MKMDEMDEMYAEKSAMEKQLEVMTKFYLSEVDAIIDKLKSFGVKIVMKTGTMTSPRGDISTHYELNIRGKYAGYYEDPRSLRDALNHMLNAVEASHE